MLKFMNNTTMKDILSRWRLIAVSTIVFALVAFIVSSLLPAKYQSDISMIVVQKQGTEKVDAFSATKSAEFLSNIFSQVIFTTSFYDAVQKAPFAVKRDFSRDPEEREKQWSKLINVQKVNNTGILNISVFDTSRTTAEETAKAIAYILTTNSEEYHGGGERVEVRLIDGPNTPLRPTVPRVLQNTVVGALFGTVLAMIFVYFFPGKLLLSHKEMTDTRPVVTYDEEEVMEEYEQDRSEDVVVDHFHNAQGTISFDDEEIDDLHKRISEFNRSQTN